MLRLSGFNDLSHTRLNIDKNTVTGLVCVGTAPATLVVRSVNLRGDDSGTDFRVGAGVKLIVTDRINSTQQGDSLTVEGEVETSVLEATANVGSGILDLLSIKAIKPFTVRGTGTIRTGLVRLCRYGKVMIDNARVDFTTTIPIRHEKSDAPDQPSWPRFLGRGTVTLGGTVNWAILPKDYIGSTLCIESGDENHEVKWVIDTTNPLTGEAQTFSLHPGEMAGKQAIDKVGQGDLVLAGELDYSGDTTIWEGRIVATDGLKTPNSTWVVKNGAQAHLNGAMNVGKMVFDEGAILDLTTKSRLVGDVEVENEVPILTFLGDKLKIRVTGLNTTGKYTILEGTKLSADNTELLLDYDRSDLIVTPNWEGDFIDTLLGGDTLVLEVTDAATTLPKDQSWKVTVPERLGVIVTATANDIMLDGLNDGRGNIVFRAPKGANVAVTFTAESGFRVVDATTTTVTDTIQAISKDEVYGAGGRVLPELFAPYISATLNEQAVIYADARATEAVPFDLKTAQLKGWIVVTGVYRVGELSVDGETNLILADGARLVVEGGFVLGEGATLNVFMQGDGSGELVVQGETFGGDGCIVINGGRITAEKITAEEIAVNGGTIVADIEADGKIVVNGGSFSDVELNAVNALGRQTYCVTFVNFNTFLLPLKVEGFNGYGARGLYPMDGKLHFYMPNGIFKNGKIDYTPYHGEVRGQPVTIEPEGHIPLPRNGKIAFEIDLSSINHVDYSVNGEWKEATGDFVVEGPIGTHIELKVTTKPFYEPYDDETRFFIEDDNEMLFKISAVAIPKGDRRNPWELGEGVTAWIDGDTGALFIEGEGMTRDFDDAHPAPWDVKDVKSVTIADGVMLGKNVLAGMGDGMLINWMTLGGHKNIVGANAEEPQFVGELVDGATAIKVVDGFATLGISVATNLNVTAEKPAWREVKFDKGTQFGLSEDGLQVLVPIKAPAKSGFFILRSGNLGSE